MGVSPGKDLQAKPSRKLVFEKKQADTSLPWVRLIFFTEFFIPKNKESLECSSWNCRNPPILSVSRSLLSYLGRLRDHRPRGLSSSLNGKSSTESMFLKVWVVWERKIRHCPKCSEQTSCESSLEAPFPAWLLWEILVLEGLGPSKKAIVTFSSLTWDSSHKPLRKKKHKAGWIRKKKLGLAQLSLFCSQNALQQQQHLS